jgi:hypothetical protein
MPTSTYYNHTQLQNWRFCQTLRLLSFLRTIFSQFVVSKQREVDSLSFASKKMEIPEKASLKKVWREQCATRVAIHALLGGIDNLLSNNTDT